MYQTRERKYPEPIQIEEYLIKRKEIRKNEKIRECDENIKENAAWILTAFPF